MGALIPTILNQKLRDMKSLQEEMQKSFSDYWLLVDSCIKDETTKSILKVELESLAKNALVDVQNAIGNLLMDSRKNIKL